MKSRIAALAIIIHCHNAFAAAGTTDSPLDKADLDAKALYKSVADAYHALSSYSDRGEFRSSINLAGQSREETSPLTIKFTRPNRIVLDAGEVRVICDGKTLTTLLVPTKRYLQAPAKPALDPTTIADGPAGAILLGGPSGPPAQILLKLLVGTDTVALPDRATAVSAEKDQVIDGRSLKTLRIELGDEPSLRLFIDPDSKLIRRMAYDLDPKSQAAKIPKPVGNLEDMKIAWDAREIQVSAIPEDNFKAVLPQGFTKVKMAEAAAPAKAEQSPLLGKAAPEFTLTVLDGAGKTRKLSNTDLKGKVIVLDFWATWCPPCLIELPEILELAESYQKKGQNGVVFIAVSQDRNPEDGSPVRKLVEDLLSSKKLELDKPPTSRVALDPGQEVGDAFGIQALPTVVLIDGQGVVQAVRVGYSEKLKDELAADIDQLLSGKRIVDGK